MPIHREPDENQTKDSHDIYMNPDGATSLRKVLAAVGVRSHTWIHLMVDCWPREKRGEERCAFPKDVRKSAGTIPPLQPRRPAWYAAQTAKENRSACATKKRIGGNDDGYTHGNMRTPTATHTSWIRTKKDKGHKACHGPSGYPKAKDLN